MVQLPHSVGRFAANAPLQQHLWLLGHFVLLADCAWMRDMSDGLIACRGGEMALITETIEGDDIV